MRPTSNRSAAWSSRKRRVKLLQNIGFDVLGAGSGQEALECFAGYHPQFIWLDIRMPMMDGLEVTRRIKITEAGKSTKIVALTASALAEDQKAVQAAGCDGLVCKPYRDQEILETMARHLDVTYTYQEAEPATAVLQNEIKLTQGQLAALPAELRQDLLAAVLALDTSRTLALIETIADPPLTAALRALAEQLEYQRLLTLLEGEQLLLPNTADRSDPA